jgi:hypothetical protein
LLISTLLLADVTSVVLDYWQLHPSATKDHVEYVRKVVVALSIMIFVGNKAEGIIFDI